MSGISYWYFEALRRWSDIDGRSRRMEYWAFSLVNAGIGLVAMILASLFDNETVLKAMGVALLILFLLLIIPGLTLTIRRLHDIGKSGWWILINFVPVVGPIVFFIFTVMGSQPGTNQYGPNPKEKGRQGA